jgi:hypothetical protein
VGARHSGRIVLDAGREGSSQCTQPIFDGIFMLVFAGIFMLVSVGIFMRVIAGIFILVIARVFMRGNRF